MHVLLIDLLVRFLIARSPPIFVYAIQFGFVCVLLIDLLVRFLIARFVPMLVSAIKV